MSRLPDFITFTGADDWTDVDAMAALSEAYPIEWGILFSPTRQGVDPRYPGGEAQSRLLWKSGLRLAAHLCGEHSRSVMDGDPVNVPVDLGFFARIQVNHAKPLPLRIAAFCRFWGPRGIAQSRDKEFPDGINVVWLHDCSGGRGLEPGAWPKHPGKRLVGYAGGIGPDNVVDVIEAIDATGPYWIDMESKVRTDNRFDLALCRRVCEAVYGVRT